MIKRAYVYSAKLHQGQIRKSGEPFLVHPLEVAGLLAQLRLDEASIVAGLLHDTLEDTLATEEELEELFGPEVLSIVDGVTKLSKYSAAANLGQEEKQAENIRKMLVAMAKDIRVLLVKLADRTHNMRTLDHMKEETQVRIARETVDIFAPLANRLGIGWIKSELEDLSFKYLKPVEYNTLLKKVQEKQKERDKYLDEVCGIISQKLKIADIEATVTGRFKHLSSIYRKMRNQNIEFEQISDIIAFRIVVEGLAQCYESLGLVHQMWKPVPGRFKDFIAIPKPNLYQSLHTTVIGPLSERIEIQIRTREMHRIAEEGIAAHWAYKEGKKGFSSKGSFAAKSDEAFAWLRQLVEWQTDLKDSREFLDTVKVDLFTDEVFVFTPMGEVRSLPRGATPVDFAYAIHSDIGNRCVGAKVNAKIVPLRYKLKNGDTVEVLTNPQAHPSSDWLNFVKTGRAQQRIRGFIKQQQREVSLRLGSELADKELRKVGLARNKLSKTGTLKALAETQGYRSENDLLVAIGYGKLSALQMAEKLVNMEKKEPGSRVSMESVTGLLGEGFGKMTSFAKKIVGQKSSSSGVSIAGINDMLVRFGRCCNPVPGDPIIGFITRGRGVTVHVLGCSKALSTDPDRQVDVAWNVDEGFRRRVSLRLLTINRPGVLADISNTFSKRDVNISQANCRSTGDERAVNTFEVGVRDLKQLNELMRSLEKLDGVFSVERL